MRDADDAIVLTDREREALARLAESIGDPWLARQLVGRDDPSPGRKRRAPVRLPAVGPAGGWVAVLMVLGGAVLALATFMSSIVVASLGLVVMGVGLWRLVVDHAGAIVSRLSARQSADPQPTGPRTPPGAA